MTSDKIIKGNKLIAEFMGLIQSGKNYIDYRTSDDYGIYPIRDLRYHSSWDWLMTVVEKIQLEHFVTIERNSTLIHEDDFHSPIINKPFGYGEQESYIQMTYIAVIDFIKWHNKQSK